MSDYLTIKKFLGTNRCENCGAVLFLLKNGKVICNPCGSEYSLTYKDKKRNKYKYADRNSVQKTTDKYNAEN